MDGLVLVTGGTGYIGGRLTEALERRGTPVRALARRPEALASRVHRDTQVVAGDVVDAQSLDRALPGVHSAYYLVHSMGATGDFAALDREAARGFAQAARRAACGIEPRPPRSTHVRARGRSRLLARHTLRAGSTAPA